MAKEFERRLLAKDIKRYTRIINLKSIKVRVKYLAVVKHYDYSYSAYILYFIEFGGYASIDNDGCVIKMDNWTFYKVPQDTLICRILDPENLNI